MEANARAGRRLGRRYLHGRWGLKLYSRRTGAAYAVVRPERSPKGSQERLLRAEAIVEHGGWEAVSMALRAGFDHFGPLDQPRLACKFAFEAMRQTPALQGYFIEKAREPDESVREHAAAELAGQLDNETRLYPRTRKALGGREGKLQEIAAAAAEAWADLQLTRSQSDREELVDSYTVALPDDLASLPGSGRREVYRIINLRVDLDNSGTVRPGGLLAYPQNEDHIETRPEKQIVRPAGASTPEENAPPRIGAGRLGLLITRLDRCTR